MLLYRKKHLIITFLMMLVTGLLSASLVSASDGNILWNDLGHNSRDGLYRTPYGAVPTGTAVTLRLHAAEGDLTNATLRYWDDRNDQEHFIPMTKVVGGVSLYGSVTLYDVWEVTLPAPALPTVYWYRFIANDGSTTVYYEDTSDRTGGWGQTLGSSQDNSWQLTFYDPNFQTPDWVKNAVIYQIFADRFRDGDSNNNPPGGEFFYNESPTVVRSNDAQGDWNATICDPRGNFTSVDNCANIYSQNFYGGDLQGIIDKLDYLQSLGVTALYLNPIFESPSNHKYDTKDFMLIDDNFGDLALFQTLSTEAHNRGINLILDGVFNHASSDSVYFDRYSRWDVNGNPTTMGNNDGSGACESLTSPFIDWFTFFPADSPENVRCSDGRDYPKWFGIFDSLPVFQHDYSEVRDYFINNGVNSVGPYWMQWADGWRLDVAPEVDHGTLNDVNDDYWEDFRTAVHAVNPDTYIVGEEWGNPTSWNLGGEWDATMNYQFSSAVLSYWRDSYFEDNDFNPGSSAGPLSPLQAEGLNNRLMNLHERYAPEAFAAMMNLFGSHDTNRVLFLLDHNAHQNNVTVYENPNYDWSDALTRVRGAALVQMTMPGAPTIYYGDEVGTVNPPSFDGSRWQDDPYNRVPYPWLDETGTPYYAHMQNASAQQALYDYYALLTSTRNNNAALRTGSLDALLLDGDIYAYGRKLADDSNVAVVVTNKSSNAAAPVVDVKGYLPVGLILTDVLTNTNYTVDAQGQLTVNVPARGGALLVANNGFTGRPATVTDLQATAGTEQVSLSWTAAADADGYDIWRSRFFGGGYDYIGNTTETTYQDTGLSNSTTYYYVVVATNSTTLLESDLSNEVNAVPQLDLVNAWYTLQWPPTLTHTLSAITPTESVYGQIYIDGATDASDEPVDGVRAQVGFGDYNDDPTTNPETWTWFEMEPHQNFDFTQNNDEYVGTMLPTATGTYNYTVRWSADGGTVWYYSQLNPPGKDYDPDNVGVLTVNPSSDVTAPAAPTNLDVLGSSGSSVTLGWDAHPDTDGDLFGFYVYRKPAAQSDILSNSPQNDGYTLVGTVEDAAATQFVDTSVTEDEIYDYQITAFDNSFNESDASNTVQATAEFRMVDVTLRVTVPDPSYGTVYVAGAFHDFDGSPYPEWNPGGIALTEVSPNVHEVTLQILDGTSINYKYTRGTWEKVEKGVNYEEIGDRNFSADYGTTGTQLVENTVASWRDPQVASFTPMADALNVDPNTTIDVVWSKPMRDGQADPVGYTITDALDNPVSGTFSYDDSTWTWTWTFTPDAPLTPGIYTVMISGSIDDLGEVQQVPAMWSFTVGDSSDTTPPTAPSNLQAALQNSDVNLTWDAHPDTDGDLAAFRVYRYVGSTPPAMLSDYTRIETIQDPSATSYLDTDAPGGSDLVYVITAMDVNGNESDESATASISTPANLVDVTLVAYVPAHTPGTVYVAGNFHNFAGSPYPEWNPGGIDLTQMAYNRHEVTLMLPENQTFEFKFTRGDWSTVEKEFDGNTEILGGGNRQLTISDSGDGTQMADFYVANWADPYVIDIVPMDGDTVARNSGIGVRWNQAMPETPTGITILDSNSNPVAGTFTYEAQANAHAFIPGGLGFDAGDYTVNVSGNTDVNGDAQQVDTMIAFSSDGSFDFIAPAAPQNVAANNTETGNPNDWYLSWDANSESDLAGYAIYRADGDTTNPDDFARIWGTASYQNWFSDSSVVIGETYSYYVTAIDGSANESGASNIIAVTFTEEPIDVTFSVDAPLHTPGDVFIVGNFGQAGYPEWDPGATEMMLTNDGNGMYSITLTLPKGSSYEYKYTRGSWDTVEKQADGNSDIPFPNGNRQLTVEPDGEPFTQSNRTMAVSDTVENWRDPYVVDYTPADGVANVDSNTTITLTWNQAMPQTLTGFSLVGSGGAVSGTVSYDDTTWTHTFTPDAPLADDTYTVTVSGNSDANSEGTQQVDTTFSFIVGDDTVEVTFTVTVPDHTPSDVFIVGSFGDAGYPNWDPGAPAMMLTDNGNGTRSITLTLMNGANYEYKYTRGSWDTVEKQADGNSDIAFPNTNRQLSVAPDVAPITQAAGDTMAVADTVENWRDPYVISHDPVQNEKETQNAIITIEWNQAMPATPSGTVLVERIDGSVSGTLIYDDVSGFFHSFVPDAQLPRGVYRVLVSGNSDVAGDSQQVATEFAFYVGPIREDLNGDGTLTPTEVIYVINRIGTNDAMADIDGDGEVTTADAQMMLDLIGPLY